LRRSPWREGSVVRATWKALLVPRRLIPILLMCAALITAQKAFGADAAGVALAALMCVVFVGLAPVAYRVLFPEGLDLSHGAVRLVLYAAIGAGAVLSVGVAVPKVFDLAPSFLSARAALLVSVAMFLVGGWGLGRDIGQEQRLEQFRQQAEHAQLLALRAHLDPHFLFNTLNAIAELCRQDGAVAEAAVLKLSELLRALLTAVKEPTWLLARELDIVRRLFELHQLRDPSRFTVEEALPSPLPQVHVPSMALLTLAENAMKHGPEAGHRGPLALRIHADSASLTVELENTGPFGGARAGSDGLPTLERRLHQLYGARATLRVASAADAQRTVAILRLPKD
jgi:hypothetical protein